MHFASFRLNVKKLAVYMILFTCVIAVAASASGSGRAEKTVCSVERGLFPAVSASDASGGSEEESLGDVGGEYESGEYDGELAVPANISLEPLIISDAVTKPLSGARISSLFGYRENPVTGKYTFHSGCDLAAPKGSEIHAIFSGKVTTASFDNGYGNYIILSHDNGLQTLYAHCSKLIAECGDSVESGEVIALVGSTGNSTGPHLHVEIRKDSKRFDPEWILGGLY